MCLFVERRADFENLVHSCRVGIESDIKYVKTLDEWNLSRKLCC